MKTVHVAIIATVLLVVAAAAPASAQDRPAPAVELAAGVLNFADDGIVTEGMFGGAARFYLLPRVSIGPEVAFVDGDRHSHLMLTGNLTYDFLGPVNGRPRTVTPFVVVGGGLYRTRESFFGTETFTHNEGAFTAGGGVRALLGRSVIVGGDVRIGWELHVRLAGFVGVQFGG